jgi:hypothetical protein
MNMWKIKEVLDLHLNYYKNPTQRVGLVQSGPHHHLH